MLSAAEIRSYILLGLPCDYVEVRGEDGQHFEAVIVSREFIGKNMVQQHQLVYRTLGERMGGEIHAMSMRTFTPEEWAKAGSKMTLER